MPSEKNGSPLFFAFTQDDKILACGLFFNERISIYDINGNYIKSIGKILIILKDKRFAPQHSHSFRGDIIFKEGSRETFASLRHGSIIEKYSMNGDLISIFYGPAELFFPEYEIVPASPCYAMNYNKKTKFGYLSFATMRI